MLDTGYGSAAWNMAVDEALLKNFDEGDLPIFRIYGWEPALSLGRFSDARKNINIQRLKQKELAFVRRMTGGGILVHGGDLSYSILLPRGLLTDIGVKESYRHLCRFLIKLYERLGLKAEFASDMKLDGHKSEICLAGIEAYDIAIDGKKMGGNAQRYTKTGLFQHGSIPISIDKSGFEDLFLEDSGLQEAATLEECGSSANYAQISSLLQEVFLEEFGADLIRDSLSTLEEEDARELLVQKYTQQRWNLDAEQIHTQT